MRLALLLLLVSSFTAHSEFDVVGSQGFVMLLEGHPDPTKEQQLNMKTDLVAGLFATIALSGRTPIEPLFTTLVKNWTWWEVVGAHIGSNDSWAEGYLGRTVEHFGTFFDLDVLQDILPTGIVSFDDWWAESGGKLDLVVSADRSHNGVPCDDKNEPIRVFERDFQAKERLCVPLNVTFSELADVLSNRSHRHVALRYFDQDAYNAFAKGMHEGFQLAVDLGVEAEAFVEQYMPQGFLSVHWRRGDRNFRWDGNGLAGMLETSLSDAPQLAGFLDIELKRLGLDTVFLATNSGVKSEVDFLRSRFRVVMQPEQPWRDAPRRAALDMAIAARADHFVMAPAVRGLYTAVSTYSRRIYYERVRLGFTGSHYSVCCGDLPAMAVIFPMAGVYNSGQDINVMVCGQNVPDEARPWLEIPAFDFRQELSDAGLQYPIRSGRILAEDEPNNYGGMWNVAFHVPQGVLGALGLVLYMALPDGMEVANTRHTVVLHLVGSGGRVLGPSGVVQ